MSRTGVRVAERVLDGLEAAFELLATNPGTGHRREDLTADEHVRFWSVGPSLIAYRRANDVIEILFVERGERDWERLLEEDPERLGMAWEALTQQEERAVEAIRSRKVNPTACGSPANLGR